MDIMVIFQTMIKLFLILVLGYVLRKVNIFDERVNKGISALVVNVTSPLLIISSISSAQGGEKSIVVKLIAIGIVMYALFVVLGKVVSRIIPFPKEDRSIYELMLVFSNTAFMGYPVLLSLFDEASIFYTSMLHMAFSFYIYTYGIITLTSKKNGKFKLDYKTLITPGLILSFVAIFIFVFNIKVPQLILETIQSVGSVTSPLSMMMIGSALLKEA